MAINWKRLGSGIAWVVFSPLALLMAMTVLGCFRCLRRAWPHLDGVLTSLRRGILRACDFRLDVPYRHTIPVLRQATPAGGRSLSCSRRL